MKSTKSKVLFGLHPLLCDKNITGITFGFDENSVHIYVHKVVLQDLTPNMTYCKTLFPRSGKPFLKPEL
jgi:hypothetical protein